MTTVNESKKQEPIVEIKDLSTELGGQFVHKNLDLTVYRGEILAIVGGSGTGKTTLVREILSLQQPTSGIIKIFGKNLKDYNLTEMDTLRRRWGVMFQQGALFGALNLLENVSFPLQEFTKLSKKEIEDIAFLKIALTGLPPDSAMKYPAELSGGMLKRAAVARAIAMDPEILFLDEPSSGLDPLSADGLDELFIRLHTALGLTIIMVTHDLDTLWKVTNRVAFLGEGKVLAACPVDELSKNEHPLVHEYFHNARARAAETVGKFESEDKS